MTLLSINPLVSPDPGLFIWSAISFFILFVLLRKMAWKPIITALDDRERTIEDALLKAEAAKEEMARMTSENEQLIKETRAERDLILREARQMKDHIINEAKEAAQAEGGRMIEKARIEINSEKAIALSTVKAQVAELSIEIAEKVLRKEFENKKEQDQLVADLLKEVSVK